MIFKNHDFYFRNDTLLLATVFLSFQSRCIEMYNVHPAHLFQQQH